MTGTRAVYDKQFFADQVRGSLTSASVIVPRILELHPDPKSVIDVGCGTGSWLRQYIESGIGDALGVDGYLPDADQLLVPADRTMGCDLSQPLKLGRRFDIAQCLEVAEHLPPAAAPGFVESLVGLSDLVVFGAAIPGQGGTHHVNEQWQSYWTALFARHGYVAVDAIRPQVWHEPSVEWWYAQNTLVYVNSRNPDLIAHQGIAAAPSALVTDIVHPRCFRLFREQLLAMQGSPHGIVSSDGADVAIMDVLPRRFRRHDYIVRVLSETSNWKTVALRHPFRVQYWLDLYRVQRRRDRSQRGQAV